MEKVKMGKISPLPLGPIVLVGANVNGKPNYMAVGALSVVHHNPLIMMVSLTKTHHTSTGIFENETFSINVPSSDLVIETDYCGIASGKTTDKSGIFTTFYGELETAPMIDECPITCECKLIDKKEILYCMVYFGRVHQVYANDKKLDISQVNPMVLSRGEYRSIGESESLGNCYRIGWSYKGTKHRRPKPKYRDVEEFQVIGIEDIGKGEDRDLTQIYTKFRELRGNIPNRDVSHTLEIHMYTNELSIKGENRLVVGNEISKVEEIPEGLVYVTIPSQKYAVFTQIGNWDNFTGTVQFVLGEWFPNNKKYERVPFAPDFIWYDARYTQNSDKPEFDWYIPIQEIKEPINTP
ncbi:MAG: flavin reductase [Promethearchaeota archaeon]|jgi:flavin reductase (DIM6/NTAB) family NADH-FMN oxidoreductase RutF/predicted transcriptional regulator YdeE